LRPHATVNDNLAVSRRASSKDRRLVTVLFTDIAGSTERAAELGDTQWRRLLDAHNRTMRRMLKRHQGREIDTAGDGFFATFQQPAHAVDCALDMIDAVAALGLSIRAGVHMGEVDVFGPKVSGMTVHLGARLMSLASGGQVIVSSTVRDLMSGSELAFVDQGVRELKGIDAEWHVYSIDGPPKEVPQLQLPEPHEPGSWWRRPVLLVAAGAALIVGVLGGVVLTRGGEELTPGVNSVIRINGDGELDRVVAVGTSPQSIAVEGETLWVANVLDSTIQRVDLDTATARPAEGGLPTGATSITTGHGLVWVGSSLEGVLSQIDPTQPNSVQAIELGGPVSDVAFGFGAVWATDRYEPALVKVDPDNPGDVVRYPLPEGSGPTGITASSDAIWVALHDSGEVARVDPDTGEVDTAVPSAAGAPDQLAVGAGFVWVTVGDGDAVIRIDERTNSAFTIDDVGDGPAGIAASDQGVWVANSLGSTVVRIDPQGGPHLATVNFDSNIGPQAVAITPSGVWVSLSGR
jgi:class 3 adenylate cyclase/sugar lactone lactonase YvrE